MKNIKKVPQSKKKQPVKKTAVTVSKKQVRASKSTTEEKRKPEIFFGIHSLRPPVGSRKKKKILGRGPSSGHGKTSTRGSKGQTSRSGRDFYLGFEGGQSPLIRRFPKRGFTSVFKKEFQIVNLKDLIKVKEGEIINPEFLENKGLIKDKNLPVKILGDGDLKSSLNIKAHAFSKKAHDKIKSAGGSAEIITNA